MSAPAKRPAWQQKAEALVNSAHYTAIAWAKSQGTRDPLSALHNECGRLAGVIGKLCAELDAFKPSTNPDLLYAQVTLDAIGATVWAALDEDGELTECWINGADIAPLLTDSAAEQLVKAVTAVFDSMRTEAQIDRHIDHAESFA